MDQLPNKLKLILAAICQRENLQKQALRPHHRRVTDGVFSSLLYFWLAGLHGTTGTPNRNVQFSEDFSDVFGSLKFALMGVFEARKNKFVIGTDLEYVSLEDDKATPGPLFSSVKAKVKTFIFNLRWVTASSTIQKTVASSKSTLAFASGA